MRRGVVGSGEQRFGESALRVIKIAGCEKLLAALEMQGESILRRACRLLTCRGRAYGAAGA